MKGKPASHHSWVAAVDQRAVGHSKSSVRYEPKEFVLGHAYDRNWILLDWVGTGKRVLEVGCSTGYMSRLMAERNCVVTGIEVDVEAAEKARRYCSEVYVMDLDSDDWVPSLRDKGFDVVLLGDVLEHLVDPLKVLHRMQEVLGKDGSLVISLPNVVHWATRLKILMGQFDYQSLGTLDHTHLRFFTLKTARELIESVGYRIVRFHPAFGGRISAHVRPIWQVLARSMPGLLAYQFLFEAKK
jgi:methionine biosynthesis protein MetW